ncbi:MAG: sulfurtransferase complex subunit TusB [Candidatus Thorarchaeota archaeon]
MKHSVLYLFGFSPRLCKGIQKLIRLVTAQVENDHNVGVILAHDGVVGAAPKTSVPDEISKLINTGASIYVLEADLEARGLSKMPLVEGLSTINYDDVIDLIVDSEAFFSWI